MPLGVKKVLGATFQCVSFAFATYFSEPTQIKSARAIVCSLKFSSVSRRNLVDFPAAGQTRWRGTFDAWVFLKGPSGLR